MEKFLKVNVKLPAPVETGALISTIQFFRNEHRLSGKKKLQSHNLAQKAAASLLASQPQSQSRAVIYEATRQAGSGDRILPFVLKHTCADIVKPRFVAQHLHNFNLLAEAYRLAFVNGGLQTKVSSGHMDCMSFIMSSSFAQVFYQPRVLGVCCRNVNGAPPPPSLDPPPKTPTPPTPPSNLALLWPPVTGVGGGAHWRLHVHRGPFVCEVREVFDNLLWISGPGKRW